MVSGGGNALIVLYGVTYGGLVRQKLPQIIGVFRVGAVVNNDDFKILMALAKDGLDGFYNVFLTVVVRDHHGDGGGLGLMIHADSSFLSVRQPSLSFGSLFSDDLLGKSSFN